MTEPMNAGMENAIRRRAELARAESRGMPITTDENDREVLLAEVDRLRAEVERLGRLADSSYSAARQKDEEIERLRAKTAPQFYEPGNPDDVVIAHRTGDPVRALGMKVGDEVDVILHGVTITEATAGGFTVTADDRHVSVPYTMTGLTVEP